MRMISGPLSKVSFHALICMLLIGWIGTCGAVQLKAIGLQEEASRQVVVLSFDNPVEMPATFSIENPAKYVLDFKATGLGLGKEEARPVFDQGRVRRVTAVAAADRLRVILDLQGTGTQSIDLKGNQVLVTLSAGPTASSASSKAKAKNKPIKKNLAKSNNAKWIEKVDFRRSEEKSGRIIFKLSDKSIGVSVREEGTKIIVRFIGAGLPEALAQRLDVTDFATPVKTVDTLAKGKDVVAVINRQENSESMAYQTDEIFVVEVKPAGENNVLSRDRQVTYSGEKLSLNFQDIEVRSVLQLIAEFTGLNIVTSDSVQGKVTLRLRNVPWDQALDLILKTKGLDKRQMGTVMLIGPSTELADQEKQLLEASQKVEELVSLRAEFIQINYAKASELSALLKDEKNSLLSSRGNVSVDDRTNTLLVQDTPSKIDEIRNLIKRLDIPVQQVMIEARIVSADDSFEEALGVKFGFSAKMEYPFHLGMSNTVSNADAIKQGGQASATSPTGGRASVILPRALSDTNLSSNFAFTLGKQLSGAVLDLELQALENEGITHLISSPRLITSNQQSAYIEQGTEIPYQEASSSGATTTSFKKAVMRLEVKPQITPDHRIILDLTVTKDTVSANSTSTIPSIDKKEVKTQVLVDNGETIVLGGLYDRSVQTQKTKIPVLGDLPFISPLFKSSKVTEKRQELMIFVTPRIIMQSPYVPS